MYDLKLVNGTIVDGTGAPRRRGDVGVKDGRIVAVGNAPEDAETVIDATDRVIAPGFIDVHTHLDAQIMWDADFGISPRHGVTSVVIGNCGFGIAPIRADQRELMLRTLENVEGMSYDALTAGLGSDWGFETFPEYLAVLERLPKAINIAALLGHTPLRYFVMGREAMERKATEDEVEQMTSLAGEAMAAGALGVSSSGSPSHNGYEGKPVPSRMADFDDEVLAVALTLKEFDRGVFMCTLGPQLSFPQLGTIARETGRPVTYAAIVTDLGGPGRHRSLLERTEALCSEGLQIVPQVSCRPVLFAFDLLEPYPFSTSAPAMMRLPVLDEMFEPVFRARSLTGKVSVYEDPTFRERLRAATSSEGWRSMLWSTMTIVDCAADRSVEQSNVLELAEERSCEPSDLLLDIALADDLQTRFVMGFVNNDIDEVERLLLHPATQIGLSDAGAHASQLCDACFPTDLLGRWVREMGRIDLETAVAMLTSQPATLFGLEGRGELRPGFAADVVVFDPATVAASTPYLAHDLPSGAARLVADSVGVDWVVVSGTPLEVGKKGLTPGHAYPGQLIRG